jgi:DNA-binding NarL/FixJ family response regulator
MRAAVAVRVFEADEINLLTDLECEILRLVAAGCRDEEIASRLSMQESKIIQEIASISDKLGISQRLELLIYAYLHGLVSFS